MENIRIKAVSSVIRLNISAAHDYRANRKTNAIAFKLSGKTVYSSNGEKYVSCNGRAILLGKGSSYELDYVQPGECFLIEFETQDGCLDGKIATLCFGKSAVLGDMLCEIERVFKYKRPYYQYELISKVYKLFYHVFSFDQKGYTPKSKMMILEPAIKYIEQNFTSDKTDNQFLASLAGISVSYFRKLFQEVYKTSPAKYVQTLRLSRAKQMLLDGRATIAEIALSSGFTSVYYFDNCFKKEMGVTPSQYVRDVLTSL